MSCHTWFLFSISDLTQSVPSGWVLWFYCGCSRDQDLGAFLCFRNSLGMWLSKRSAVAQLIAPYSNLAFFSSSLVLHNYLLFTWSCCFMAFMHFSMLEASSSAHERMTRWESFKWQRKIAKRYLTPCCQPDPAAWESGGQTEDQTIHLPCDVALTRHPWCLPDHRRTREMSTKPRSIHTDTF